MPDMLAPDGEGPLASVSVTPLPMESYHLDRHKQTQCSRKTEYQALASRANNGDYSENGLGSG